MTPQRTAAEHHRARSARGIIVCTCGLTITDHQDRADADALAAVPADLLERAWRHHTDRPDIPDGCCGCPPCAA